MESFWKRVAFGLILTYRMLWQTTCSSDCPFYTFHENTKNWRKARLECQANGGDLLSIETENEYQFINKSIQNLNKGINEWYIGLKKTTGVWKWINGRSLSINKWQPREPSRDGSCVIMAKNWPPGKYGLFNDLRCSVPRMFICEFKEVSNNVQGVLKYCQGEIATTRPITTTPSATRTKSAIIHELTSLSRSHSAVPTTIKSYTERNTSRRVSPNPRALRTPGKTSKQFPTIVVAIILGILLAVGICAFFVVFWWLKRKSGQSKSKREPWQSYTAATPTAENRAYLTNRRNNLSGQPATEAIQLTELDSELYAEIPDDLRPSDSPSSLSEVEYANSPSSTLPPSGYANLIQNPVYENQMPYETLNRYTGDMEEGEIAI